MAAFAGTITVKKRPIRFAPVEICRLKTPEAKVQSQPELKKGKVTTPVHVVGTEEKIGSAVTDEKGAFSITPDTAPGPTDKLCLRIRFKTIRSTKIVHVLDADGATWTWKHPTDRYFGPSDTALGTIEAPHLARNFEGPGNFEGGKKHEGHLDSAALIFERIVEGYRWYGSGTTTPLRPVRVLYPSPSADGAYYNHNTQVMYIPEDRATFETLILHEYGHEVYMVARADGFSGGGPKHYLGLSSDDPAIRAVLDNHPHHEDMEEIGEGGNAGWLDALQRQLQLDFFEAYASFFAQQVLASTKHVDRGVTFDVETLSCSEKGDVKRIKLGYGDGPTLAYLWDLCDSGTDGGKDTFQEPWSAIHKLYIDKQPRTLPEFHEHLKAAYPAKSAALDAIAGLANLTKVVRYTPSWIKKPTSFAPATR